MFETPSHSELLELIGVRDMVSDVIDELLRLAEARGCSFSDGFKNVVMEQMVIHREANSIMYQDYAARRPMEVETYLGAPLKLAKESSVKLPRVETLYALLHHVNVANQKRPASTNMEQVPQTPAITPRMNGGPPPPASSRGPPMNGGPPPMGGPMPPPRGRGSRAPSMTGPPPPMMRRGPPPTMNGQMPHPRGPPMQRRPSFENGNGLDDFAHLMLYDTPESTGGYDPGAGAFAGPPSHQDIELRERELMLRQKEIALREREMGMGRPPRARAAPSHLGDFDEEDGEEDFFDPMAFRGPPVDPDNVDMLSITSKRNRKQPSMSQIRHNPEAPMNPQRRSNPFGRPNRNRQSSRLMSETPNMHGDILDNPLVGYSSDRYGGFDRGNLGREGRESRSGSLTTARLSELQQGPPPGYGGYPPVSRRTSQSPGTPLSPNGPPMRGGGYSPPYGPPNGPLNGPLNGLPNGHPTGRPSPPNMRQPIPRYPPGHGNSVAPQQVESRAGVSNLYPTKNGPQVRSLTGSASASAGSGDSGQSAQVSAENSAFSSQSSLGPRPPIGVR